MESYRGAIHSAKDAIILVEAARLRLIPRVMQRLNEHERSIIKPGDVFVWSEKEAKMRRWTDGRSWSASRVSGAFLTYREMESSNDDKSHEGIHHSNYSYKTDGLIKQSFSLTTLKGDKLHLVSYTTTGSYINSKFHNKTPSTDPMFGNIRIPTDLYPEFSFADSNSEKLQKPRRVSSCSSSSSSPVSQALSPIPSPRILVSESGSSPSSSFNISSRVMTSKTPRIHIEDLTQNTRAASLPPLEINSIPLTPIVRKNSTNQTRYDFVALNALDKFSFRF